MNKPHYSIELEQCHIIFQNLTKMYFVRVNSTSVMLELYNYSSRIPGYTKEHFRRLIDYVNY